MLKSALQIKLPIAGPSIQDSHLLRAANDVRLMIYDTILENNSTDRDGNSRGPWAWNWSRGLALQFLLTCRQVYDEAKESTFKKTTFNFRNYADLAIRLQSLSDPTRNIIRIIASADEDLLYRVLSECTPMTMTSFTNLRVTNLIFHDKLRLPRNAGWSYLLLF